MTDEEWHLVIDYERLPAAAFIAEHGRSMWRAARLLSTRWEQCDDTARVSLRPAAVPGVRPAAEELPQHRPGVRGNLRPESGAGDGAGQRTLRRNHP